MKFISKITVILFVFTITSCQPLYYQVYNTKNNPLGEIKLIDFWCYLLVCQR